MIKGVIHVIAIEVPEIVRWQIQVVSVSVNLAKEEDVSVALTDSTLFWRMKIFDDVHVLREQVVVQIVDGSRAND